MGKMGLNAIEILKGLEVPVRATISWINGNFQTKLRENDVKWYPLF